MLDSKAISSVAIVLSLIFSLAAMTLATAKPWPNGHISAKTVQASAASGALEGRWE